MSSEHHDSEPASLILDHLKLLTGKPLGGPLLDLACGDGHNGIFLATKGLDVILCDISEDALKEAGKSAEERDLKIEIRQLDLEKEGVNPFDPDAFGAILVFRYLHRPLIPFIKRALMPGGLLFYETFTVEQRQFGKPTNPDFLLKPGELPGWFREWETIHEFEGILEKPRRAMAQVVCRKPVQ